MNALLDDLAETVVAGGDDGQAGSERFETGIGKRIVERRQEEDVGGGVERGKIAHRSELPHGTPINLAATAAPGNEKAKFFA